MSHPLRAYVQHLPTCLISAEARMARAFQRVPRTMACTCGLDLALSRSEQDEEKNDLTRVDGECSPERPRTAASHED